LTDDSYLRWVTEAWDRLEKDFLCRKFTPTRREYDVQAHLYHCMFQLKDRFAAEENILLTLEWNDVDLSVIRYNNPSDTEPQLLVQLKETHYAEPRGNTKEARKEWIYKRIQDDSMKLKKFASSNQVVSLLFWNEKNLFCDSPRTPIGQDTNNVCAEIGGELLRKGTLFLYGPKPVR
jgi:hypothetical protein